ncbi:MAG: rRNA adenine N-6-methyltransferase family protein, partial [Opitutae bacterium]
MPLTPSETTQLLSQLGHHPKKKLGQNFLTDGNIVEKSIEMADLPENMPVVEIGPGLGTLTRKLLEGGHEVHAIEIDRTLFANLEKSLDSYLKNKQLTLTHGD